MNKCVVLGMFGLLAISSQVVAGSQYNIEVSSPTNKSVSQSNCSSNGNGQYHCYLTNSSTVTFDVPNDGNETIYFSRPNHTSLKRPAAVISNIGYKGIGWHRSADERQVCDITKLVPGPSQATINIQC